ncbi:hypothetical protein [Streptomyces paradoxus]|uniref:Uncharacterized protein n=1 Tax=Streptomyces paradoxus TaxID=66375 RepID=A0A7W9TJ17_9ACTN|nr:hypothetical protein [Streptomyces paradoxus]MBB6081624.1 hypothetical protein [Streptomyces paradoxus]
MSDGSKGKDVSNTPDEPEGRIARRRRRLWEWRIHQHAARGMAYGVGSGAVSLLLLWVQSRY